MIIPVYVVTGFLGAGKTTFLNSFLNSADFRDRRRVLIQFESGEEEFRTHYRYCDEIIVPKRILDNEFDQVVQDIHGYLLENMPDEIWVEWNGVTSFTRLQELLYHSCIYQFCRLQKVIHIADARTLEGIIGRTGGALPEQIASSDFALIHDTRSKKDFGRIKQVMRSVNPGLKVFDSKEEFKVIKRQTYRKKIHAVNLFFSGILVFLALAYLSSSFLKISDTSVNAIIQVFLGIVLQAIPFLLIGVLISSVIQVFISAETIERRFPKNIGLGMIVAILSGFFLPVCDCASIPIFRSLVKKGIPLPVAVTFMVATPVINPVVMLSTYYAFGGNSTIVYMRVIFGILAALLIGACFALWPSKGKVFSGGYDGMLCNCGCYDGVENIKGFKGKISLLLRHSQVEFFDVGKYLMIGAFAAAFFQTIVVKLFSIQGNVHFTVALLFMMTMAFLLSLCSSSDAVIARSFATNLPTGSIFGFLIFGPMMDVKNVIMLSGSFTKRFILKLFIVTFSICFLLIALFLGG